MDNEQMREDIYDAVMSNLTPRVPDSHSTYNQAYRDGYKKGVRSAIAAAEPHIRRKVLEELIADTVWMDAWAERGTLRHERMSESRRTITDWLRSKLEG